MPILRPSAGLDQRVSSRHRYCCSAVPALFWDNSASENAASPAVNAVGEALWNEFEEPPALRSPLISSPQRHVALENGTITDRSLLELVMSGKLDSSEIQSLDSKLHQCSEEKLRLRQRLRVRFFFSLNKNVE